MPQQGQQQQTPAKLEGAVLNAVTGEPLKRVAVMLLPMQAMGPMTPATVLTDASGQFSFASVSPGNYRVMAERTGYVRTEYGSKAPMRPGTQITLAAGQTLKEISIRLQPHGVIAGRVLDEDGEPLAGVQVMAMTHRYMQGRKQLMPAQGSSTNDLGEYRIFGLAPGKYFLSAVYRGTGGMGGMAVERASTPGGPVQDEGYAPTYYPGTNDSSAAVPLQSTSGQALTNIDVRLQRTRTVRVKGRVVGAPGHARVMVMMMAQNDFMGGGRQMASPQGPDGAFEIRGVTPGSYHVAAQVADQNGQLTARTPINVGNSNVENIELVLRPGTTVTGRVRIEGESQVTPSQVSVNLQPIEMSPFGGGGSAQVNADGTFTVQNVQPNTYRVVAFVRPQGGGYVKSVFAGDQELRDSELVVGDGAAPTLQITLGIATAKVAGQVAADPPTANQGAMVVLLPPGEKRERMDLFRTAMVDGTGKFSINAVPPGEYTAYAWDSVEPGAWQDPEFLQRFEAKGKKVVLKENDSITLELELLKVEPAQ
jgi:protocatechuate 3,4-dioxygenase beta subunit